MLTSPAEYEPRVQAAPIRRPEPMNSRTCRAACCVMPHQVMICIQHAQDDRAQHDQTRAPHAERLPFRLNVTPQLGLLASKPMVLTRGARSN